MPRPALCSMGSVTPLALTWVRRHESMVVVLAPLAGANPRNRPENTLFAAGSGVLQCARDAVLAAGTSALSDARDDPRAAARERPATSRAALDQTPEGGLVLPHHERQEAGGDDLGLRGLPPASESQRRQAENAEAAVCGVACARFPTEIRERYRTRFGIETSYRQMRQARIYTCTRKPHLRLFFVAVAMILRNVWVWIHQTRLAEGAGDDLTLHLELLRFKRMLDWIVHEVVALFHDGSIPCVTRPP